MACLVYCKTLHCNVTHDTLTLVRVNDCFFSLKIKDLSVHNQAVNHLHSFDLAAFDRDTDFTLFHHPPGISEATENPYGEDDSKSPFPLQPSVKRSYAQNVTVWIKASGLQVQ